MMFIHTHLRRRSILSFLLVGLSLPLAALDLGCRRAPPPEPAALPAPPSASSSPVQSVRKLDGAPARVLETRFSPDGASLLVLECRPPKDESAGEPRTYAISRRPIAGGAAKDLISGDTMMIAFTAFGEGVLTIQRPQSPPAKDDDDDDADARWDTARAALEKTALYRIDD